MSKPSSQRLVFLSYAPFDDKHDRGRLAALADLLEDEVRLQRGEDFSVFLDRSDIQMGDRWRNKIEEALRRASAFVAIITPSYLKSRYCRQEVNQFLERERTLKRRDMIIPVLYLGDYERLPPDELSKEIGTRNLVDWRDLRFERFDSPLLREKVHELARRIGSVVEHG